VAVALKMTSATFFISTGRCATQWFASVLKQHFPDEVVVTHEPIRAAYHPKRNLRAADPEAVAQDPLVREHLADIEKILASGKSYVETGWPCYPAMPLLAARFGERTRFVHIVRHPVHVALSLATHRIYQRKDWIADAAIDPFDPGVVQKELAPAWTSMGEYEKALFWWTEINLYALEMQKALPVSEFMSIRYEDLFATPAQPQLLANVMHFMGLPHDAKMDAELGQRVDSYVQRTDAIDWRLIFRYPRTCELAESFGYRLDELSDADLKRRYGRGDFDLVARTKRVFGRLIGRR
jgi:hypothetical protein